MRDVAQAAGVSVMTVSYLYSRPERVSADAAAKVRAAAHALGYPGPHPAARSLRQGRAGTLGVVLGERLSYAFDDPQAARFLAGVADVCAVEGVGLTLVPITGADTDVDRVARAVVDGFVIWTTSDDDPVLDAVADSGLPAVVHGGPAKRGLPVIGMDDRAAAAAIGRVAFAGARRPVVLGFPLDRRRQGRTVRGDAVPPITYPVTRNRWAGFRDAWSASGRDVADLRLAECPENAAVVGEQVGERLFGGVEPPDAVAAMSDELAVGVLRAAARAGWTVPGDVAVTGWDDSEIAERAGLSTVAQSLREQGASCARAVLGAGAGAGAGSEAQPWRLVLRSTTRASAAQR